MTDEERREMTRQNDKSLMRAMGVEDIVRVVRCRDCKYSHMTYGDECKYCDFWQDDGGDALYLDGDFYCAAGERRDGDG